METKKPTNAQLQRRIDKAIIHLDRTKDTKEIFFDDKFLRLTCDETQGYAIVATMFHRHVFDATTANGVSRPFVYIARLIDIALANDCIVKDEKGKEFHSYAKLMETLKNKKEQFEYNLMFFIDLWLNNIFLPLYEIDETETNAFLLYERYMHNVARNAVVLSEKTEDMTNKQFVDEVLEKEKSFLEGVTEKVLFPKLTDKERQEQEINALQEQMQEQVINESK